ncbi:MAG TPA: molybdopterin oxidoreductase family protein [Verrucomicrobiae bacterium]|jgi:assimilatory nitrate reductase catalytic subunit|nr:molybdopterin oxidoreductase family protein [Verrucomicrobiae bacterium]
MKARRANSLLRQWAGPMTTDLVRSPGEFGLGQVPARLKPDATTSMVCGFCSTGCGLNIHLRDGQAVNLTPDPIHPVNLGMACPKGWEALTPLSASDRGATPLLRDATGQWRQVGWHPAMAEFCARMKDVQARHGPHSIAFLGTGQICTEEMALLGCLFRFGMGGFHCDSNTRQCMATAHVAYKQSFGFDAPPFTYADFEESDVLVFVGANPCIAHPIMWQRVMRNQHRPEIIVVDPRLTETAMAATQHYALRPKSDLTLLYGVAHRLLALDAINRSFVDAHTSHFDEFARFLERFTPELVCAESGLTRDQLDRLAGTIAKGKRVSFWWTMGVNQGHEATRTAQAVINLALMTGNIGRPGTGANSITGQCNAMGSRLYSNITSLIGGHDFGNPVHRAKVSAVLGVAEELMPTEQCWAYDQIVEGIADGKIRALWVIATNGSHSWIHQNKFNDLLAKLEFLVVQDMYPSTETAQRAHLFLPAAGWGEKEGTLINSERRIGLIKKVRRAPGLALADFHIFRLIAEYWGCGKMFEKWRAPEAVFQVLKELSRGQPCDITGIRDYRMIDECGGIQWPWAEASGQDIPPAERRLFGDGFFHTQDQRAKFFFDTPRPLIEPTNAEFPFVLLTGRGTSAQWHTGSRTNKSDVLRALSPAHCYVEINPKDAARLDLKPGATVRVRSRRASLVAVAFVTPTVQPGQVFIPMHYAEVNRLTHPSFDPHSRQPNYKHCAVTLEKPDGKIAQNAAPRQIPSL